MNTATSLPHMSMRAALLGSALALPILGASGAAAQDATISGDACVQLEGLSNQVDYTAAGVTEEDLLAAVEAGDAARCATVLSQVQTDSDVKGKVADTEQAIVRLEDEVVIEGVVVVDQQPPSVQIEEQAAEVTVGEANPEVTVSEGQLDILVRQASPTIKFEMPQPTITISQPAPEVIVTMPDPSVDVANARPQIEVRQAKPIVNVTVPEATVNLDLRRAENPESSEGIAIQQGGTNPDGTATVAGDPEVALTQTDAQIVYLEDEAGGSQATVSVNRREPNIRFEQAEPQVEVTAMPDPQVNWTQTGEPVITFNESAGVEGAEQQTEANAAMSNEAAPVEADGELIEQPVVGNETATAGDPAIGNARPNVRREGFQTVDLSTMTASDLEGATLYGVNGEDIGEIGNLVITDGAAQDIVADVGGFLGMGERQVRVPMSDITLLESDNGGQLRAYINATEDRLMSYPEAE